MLDSTYRLCAACKISSDEVACSVVGAGLGAMCMCTQATSGIISVAPTSNVFSNMNDLGAKKRSLEDLQVPLILRGNFFQPTSILRTDGTDYGDTLQVSTEIFSTTSLTTDFDVVMDDESSHFDQKEKLAYLAMWSLLVYIELRLAPVKSIPRCLGGLVLEFHDVNQKHYRRVGVYDVTKPLLLLQDKTSRIYLLSRLYSAFYWFLIILLEMGELLGPLKSHRPSELTVRSSNSAV